MKENVGVMDKAVPTKHYKSEYWQFVRGICILAVIMIHCPSGISYSPVEQGCWLVLRQFINFPVAMFVFMAGYFLNINKTKKSICVYLLNRGVRLLIPYFLWSTVYLFKDFVVSGDVSIRYIIYAYCTGKASGPLYYIVVLVQLTLLTPWLAGMRDRRWLYAITPVYLVLLYIFNITTGEMPSLYETIFPAWFDFYILGMDSRMGKWDTLVKMVRNWWIAAALVLSIIEALLLLKIDCAAGFAASQIRFGGALYTGVIALVLVKKRRTKAGDRFMGRLLISVGDCSYGIFYIHTLVMMVVQKLVSMVGLTELWLVNFLLCFAMTAIGSYLIVYGIKMLAEKLECQKTLKILGF